MSTTASKKPPLERLEQVYKFVNERYFDGKIQASYAIAIPRGEAALAPGRASASRCQMVGTGVPAAEWNFNSRTANFHPILFHKKVPRYVLVYLMHHELTHCDCPPGPGEDVHNERFMVKEAIAPHRHEATRWLRARNFPTMALD